MRTNVYIDGFNLYYGCIKGTPYKWLNPLALCQLVFPKDQIHRVRYFTAIVHPTPSDPQKPQRQMAFIRALRTIPDLSVHQGLFLSHVERKALANPVPGGPRLVDVIETEEKGSDVNLATYLLVDGYEGDYDTAIVVSNDSDLVEPIQVVRNRLHLSVGVLNPQMDKRKTSWALVQAAAFYRRIRIGALAASQFPSLMSDESGTFQKPAVW